MKLLIKISILAFTVTTVSALMGCTTAPKTWGNGKYTEAGYDEPYSYTEGLNEFDQKHLMDAAIASLEKCNGMRMNSVYMISDFENQTSETIDVAMLQRELNDKLTTKGFTVVDKTSRPELFNEMQYQSTGYVAPHLAAVKGKQAGVEYMLRAAIVSKSQNTDNLKTVRYRISLQAVNLETSVVMCSPSVEIKKAYERTRIAL